MERYPERPEDLAVGRAAKREACGYYTWVDDRTFALFVLGDRGQPATLQIADTQTGKAELVATGIGRSIQRMPSGQISFVHLEPRS